MKKYLIIIALVFVLTSCFGAKENEISNSWSIISENTNSGVTNSETETNSWELLDEVIVENTSTWTNNSMKTWTVTEKTINNQTKKPEDEKVSEEVLKDFEWELDNLFKMLDDEWTTKK